MRACPACGASNSSTDDFCGNCGAYLGWSDTTPAATTPRSTPLEPSAPSTLSEPPASPDPTPPDTAPVPASPPADEPASAAPARTSSLRTRLTGRGRSEARGTSATNATNAAGSRSGVDEGPGADPGHAETLSPPPQADPDDVRTEPPAPGHGSTTGDTTSETTSDDETPHTDVAPPTTTSRPAGAGPAASGTGARPPQAPAAPSAPTTPCASTTPNVPGPRPPAAPTPETPTPDPVLPVRPAKPVAPRPVVRPAEVPDEVTGVPCPACGTPNPPYRRFCRRCATELNPAAKPAPLPWWRTVWPFRRRVRASSGRGVRLLVILAVVVALCAGGFLLLPAGRALIEDTRDKLGKPKAVTPVAVEASAEVPRHPATNTTDGLRDRYWGAPAPGASVTYTFRKPFRLIDLVITNGASVSPEDYARQARALQLDLEVTTQDGKKHTKELTLSDKPGPQTIPTGISDAKTVRLVLRSAVGLSPGRHLALAEVEFFQRS
ncbi:NADase-type glycan-binding domain-containing protein [Streptomyces sp. NBC_01615]|uniref:NADase-type glycan-binding domain-containing protein n=1 Tax=Streptomyces sp. NBC_01615 TaxID=2975898 RepID=UPI00386C5793